MEPSYVAGPTSRKVILTMIAFRPGLAARKVHSELRQALTHLRRAERNAVLWFGEVARRRLYLELGYATIHLYAEQGLGFSRSKTYQFLRLAEDLERLPALKAALADGSVSWTKARTVAVVADQRSESAWVERAKQSSVVALRQDVALAKSHRKRGSTAQPELMPDMGPPLVSSTPINVNLRLHPTDAARMDGMLERIRKLGLHGSREELVLLALDRLKSKKSTRVHSDNRSQIVIYKCSDCGRAHVETDRGSQALSPSDLEAAECDAKLARPGERNRSTIPPSIRRAAMLRDRFTCRAPGCHNRRFLEVHHKRPRAEGGAHVLENLVTLCGACHRQAHRARIRRSSASEETESHRGYSTTPSHT